MPTKLSAEHADRLKCLGDGWEDSEAQVTINAKDAAALGVPVDQHELTGEPLNYATVRGHDLYEATRNLTVAE